MVGDSERSGHSGRLDVSEGSPARPLASPPGRAASRPPRSEVPGVPNPESRPFPRVSCVGECYRWGAFAGSENSPEPRWNFQDPHLNLLVPKLSVCARDQPVASWVVIFMLAYETD